ALADAVALTVTAPGTATLAASETIGSLAGDGTVALNANALTTGGNNASTTFSGLVSGAGSLVKTGTGAFTLSGTNSYSGGTELQAGTLGLAANGAIGSGSLAASAGTTIAYGSGLTFANLLDLTGPVTVTQASPGLTTQSGRVTGTSQLTKSGAGSLDFTDLDGTFSRLTTTGGSFNVTNTGTVGGSGLALEVTGGRSTFTNADGGALAGFFTASAGTELDIVNASGGTVTLGAGSTSTLGGSAGSFQNFGEVFANGNTSLSSLATFSNSGTIDLDSVAIGATSGSEITTNENRTAGDRLTIGGNFVAGSGSTLVIDADFGTAGTSDQLVVSGTGTGSATNIVFNNTNATGRFGLQSSPIVIASFGGGYSGDSPTTFGSNGLSGTRLATENSGPVDYELSASGNQWIVSSSLNSDAVGGFAASLAASQSLIAAALSRPSSSFVSAPIQPEANATGYSPWIRAIGGTVTSSAGSFVVNPDGSSDSSDAKIGLDYAGVQMGFDIGRFNINDSSWNVNVGVTGGYNAGNAEQQGVANDTDFTTSFIGTYVTVSRESFFAEIQARYDYTEFDILAPTFGENELEANSKRFSINSSAGYSFEIAEDANVTPTVGLSYANTDTSSINTDFGTLNFEDTMSLMGYGSVTLSKAILLESGTEALQPFITGTIYNDFGDDIVSSFDDGNGLTANVETDNIGTYGEFSIGLNYRAIVEDSKFGIDDVTGAIRADFAVGDKTEGAGLTGQLRLQF
ncbi:MAG: autotransporter domain-containing protein, partial [Rhizobiaceae bacterium]|nr:autotransporter domain-containing protein [Rhizobiaceae bacterium]